MPGIVPLLVGLSLSVLSHGQMRLYSQTGRTSNLTAGRLEIFHNNQWSTHCFYSFDIASADIACRHLGFPSGANGFETTRNLQYPDTGPIFREVLGCSPSNTSLRCTVLRNVGRMSSCDHSKDVILSCLTEGSVRLIIVSSQRHYSFRTVTGVPSNGLLEVYIDGRWGTVCGNGYSIIAAQVVCQQLGFFQAVSWIKNEDQGAFAITIRGKVDILLDNVQCRNTDQTLLSCRHTGVGVHTCPHDHSQDVVVNCKGTDRASRLVNTRTKYALQTGRLELLINDQWGTVCDDSFSVTLANIACHQLGFSDGAVAYDSAGNLRYGPADTDAIWDLDCSSSDTNLRACRHTGIGMHNCDHSQDVILSCATDQGSVRLVGSSSGSTTTTSTFTLSGRLEVHLGGHWGTVCGNNFGRASAQVVCAQLGFSRAVNWTNIGSQSQYPSAPNGMNISLDNVQCRSTELTLFSCPADRDTRHCDHSQDVVVSCIAVDPVRLVSQAGNTSHQAGRLEIFFNNQWGAVCNDSFSITDANVACRQLGFSSGAIAYDSAVNLGYNTSATDPIWLDDLDCSSSDTQLRVCGHAEIGVHNCDHSQDVILSCLTEGSVRLAVSSSSAATTTTIPQSGRLEVYIDGHWGTVCDKGFRNTSAQVVCQQLGFSHPGSWITIGDQNEFPRNAPSGTPILLDNVQCSSFDQTILSCRHNEASTSCAHLQDVVVYCEDYTFSEASRYDPAVYIGASIGATILTFLVTTIFILACVFFISTRGRRGRPTVQRYTTTSGNTYDRTVQHTAERVTLSTPDTITFQPHKKHPAGIDTKRNIQHY